MSTDMVLYTPMDVDELEAQEKQIGFGSPGGTYFQFKDGRNTIRVLPGIRGRQPFVQFWKHFVKASADGKAYGGACPHKMAKQGCPTCQVAAQLSRSPSQADRDLAQDISPRRKVLCNVIDRSSPDAGPQVAEFGPSIYDAIKDVNKAVGEDPTHPTEGFDLIVEKSGSGLRTEYKVTAVRKNSPIHSDAKQMGEWLESMADLSQQVLVMSEVEITTKLAGTVVGHLLGKRTGGKPRDANQARASAAAASTPDDEDGNY
jgi:hypothetical protein